MQASDDARRLGLRRLGDERCDTWRPCQPLSTDAAQACSRATLSSHKDLVLPHQERVNIAVFIDFDNIEIGVKTTLGEHFDIGIILEALKERGEVVTKIAYADWTRAGEYSRALTQHAIRLVQRNLTPGGDKNGADINLALDALEMAFTHPHINAYVIVGGDSDFLSLVEKLKQYDKKVFVVGGRAFTSVILQRNCHEFIAYENLQSREAGGQEAAGRCRRRARRAPIAQAFPIVRRALKILADREVSPQTGLLKSTLLQLDSTFSERNYGASSFLDFVEKLAQAGLVQLKHAGRSVMVELNEAVRRGRASDRPRDTGVRRRSISSAAAGSATRPAERSAGAPVRPTGTIGGLVDAERRRRPGAARRPSPTSRPTAAGRRRAARGGHPARRDHGALADVPAQRETAPARGRRRLRRTALRVRRAGRAAARLPEGRPRAARARPPRRPAGVPGPGAAAAAHRAAAPGAQREPDRRHRNVQAQGLPLPDRQHDGDRAFESQECTPPAAESARRARN